MNCPICKNLKNVIPRCDYKYEIKEDIKYFGKLNVYKCKECDFSFANPMPEAKNLDYFYKNIYRQVNRPPYWVTENDKDSEKGS